MCAFILSLLTTMCFAFKNMLTITPQATETLEVPHPRNRKYQIDKINADNIMFTKQTDALEGNEQWGKAVMLKAAKQDIRKGARTVIGQAV